MTKQLRLKFVQEPDDCIHFLFSKRLVERNAQFFGVYLLGYGQLLFCHFLVAKLSVRRYRIVNLRLHAVLKQILLQFVALFAQNGEDMVHALLAVFH